MSQIIITTSNSSKSSNDNLVQDVVTDSLNPIVETSSDSVLSKITISNSSKSSDDNLVQDVATDSLNPIVETSSDSVLSQITIRSVDKQSSDFESDINNLYSPYLFQQLSLQELIIGSAGFVVGTSLGILGSIITHKHYHHSSKTSSGIEMVDISTPMLAPEIVI